MTFRECLHTKEVTKLEKRKRKLNAQRILMNPGISRMTKHGDISSRLRRYKSSVLALAINFNQMAEYLTECINISECQIENVPTSYIQFRVFRVENKSDSIEWIIPRNSHSYFVNR